MSSLLCKVMHIEQCGSIVVAATQCAYHGGRLQSRNSVDRSCEQHNQPPMAYIMRGPPPSFIFFAQGASHLFRNCIAFMHLRPLQHTLPRSNCLRAYNKMGVIDLKLQEGVQRKTDQWLW